MDRSFSLFDFLGAKFEPGRPKIQLTIPKRLGISFLTSFARHRRESVNEFGTLLFGCHWPPQPNCFRSVCKGRLFKGEGRHNVSEIKQRGEGWGRGRRPLLALFGNRFRTRQCGREMQRVSGWETFPSAWCVRGQLHSRVGRIRTFSENVQVFENFLQIF